MSKRTLVNENEGMKYDVGARRGVVVVYDADSGNKQYIPEDDIITIADEIRRRRENS